MAVAFDTQSTLFTGAATTSFTNATHTIGSISNGVLVVILQFIVNTVSAVTVKWDNTGTPQTMTQIGSKKTSNSDCVVFMFGLLAPHTGLKTLAVSWTTSSAYGGMSISYSGASQAAFATTFKNLTTDASTVSSGHYPAAGLSVPTISGDMAIMGATTSEGGFSSAGGLGTQFGLTNTNVSADDRYLAAVGASTVLAANENTASSTCAAVGCAIAAVGNVGGGIIPGYRLKQYLRR